MLAIQYQSCQEKNCKRKNALSIVHSYLEMHVFAYVHHTQSKNSWLHNSISRLLNLNKQKYRHENSLSEFCTESVMSQPMHYAFQQPNYAGFVVVGAGLPRTGTSSLRSGHQRILIYFFIIDGVLFLCNTTKGPDEVSEGRGFAVNSFKALHWPRPRWGSR